MGTLKYPIEHGIVTNWDDMEKIWHRWSASTLYGLVGPSFRLSVPSSRCGFPRVNTMSLARRSSTGSVSERGGCFEVIALLRFLLHCVQLKCWMEALASNVP